MTNAEFYREEFLKPREYNYEFCRYFVEPVVLKQYNLLCKNTGCTQCRFICQMWLNEEHKESEVDWSKVGVDTLIYVRDSVKDEWIPRYFAKYENRRVYAWNDGRTSFTIGTLDNPKNFTSWEYAKLAETDNK